MSLIPGATGVATTFPDGFLLGAGTVTAPSYRLSDAQTGFYRPGLNQWALSTAGVQSWLVDASGNWTVGIDGATLHTVRGTEFRRIAGTAAGDASKSFYTGTGAGTLRATMGVAGTAGNIVTGTALGDFAINMATGQGLQIGVAGASILSATSAGAFTFGSASDTPYTTFHTINKSLFSGTPSSATDLNGTIRFGSNSYSSAGQQPTRVSGLTGVQIAVLNRTSDTAGSCFFQANLAADTATTSAATVGSFTGQGAWTLGASGGTQTHNINGLLRMAPVYTSSGFVVAGGYVVATGLTQGTYMVTVNTVRSSNEQFVTYMIHYVGGGLAQTNAISSYLVGGSNITSLILNSGTLTLTTSQTTSFTVSIVKLLS